MRILITGATGLVGNNCLRTLQADGHELHVLVRPGYDQRTLEGVDVQCHYGDLLRPDKLGDNVPEVDTIIHSAGDTHIGKRPRPSQWTINVDATRKLAELALARHARFVFVSSVDALPALGPKVLVTEETQGSAKHDCGYVRTKRQAEAALAELVEKGLDAVIVNPGFMLGPWDWKPSSGRMLVEVATRFTPFGPKGGFSVCDVREVAKAIGIVATQDTPHSRYILAGNNVRYIEAWRVFADVAEASGPWCVAGWLARHGAGWWGDWMARLTGREGDVNSAGIGMSDLFHYYDSRRAQEVLGYQIPTVRESTQAAWTWFQEHGYVNPS